MMAHVDVSNKALLPNHPVQFTSEDLRTHLEPIIHKMLTSEYSYPFRQPVDPVAFNIPDYPTIIKHPMDISTIYNKLLHKEYQNPMEFCDDVWLMFNNAWLYNKRSQAVYKMCTRLAEFFVESINPVLQTLGYCCARQYVYLPPTMLCYGNSSDCQIPCCADYYYYKNPDRSRFNLSNDQYTFCCKCFSSIPSDSMLVGDDPKLILTEISKSLFSSARNNIQKPETMIECRVCTRRWHQVCALHFDQIWSEGFICNTCVREYNIKCKENPYRAQNLPVTDLSSKLEKRVNDFLHNENCHTSHVTIRVLATNDKICQVKPQLKKYYPNQIVTDYPYRMKAIFAFQQIDGVDVVFFGMYVQEYDEQCPTPNTRRVYISYVDTVNFFQPKAHRTNVYHEILIGYLDYVKQQGYMYAHIWAHPASEGVDYIFYRHPSTQRMPKAQRMYDWCKKMFDKAIEEGIVIDYKDIKQDCLDNQIQTVFDIPYLDGDFWPSMIEDHIKTLNQEQEVEIIQSIEDLDLQDSTEISRKRKCTNTYEKKKMIKTADERKLINDQSSNSTDLLSALISSMEKYKKSFFVIRLHNRLLSYPTIHDNNARIHCDLMGMRDVFLTFAIEKNYEFSSLRRAKYSTMAMLYEIHTSSSSSITEIFTYSCNKCRQQCDDICYYCTICEDFDLCEKCSNMEPKHEHKMERRILPMRVVSQGDKSIARIQSQQMHHCIQALNILKME